ncbi:MAG: hypothetical protein KDA52_16910 [Planctomycetaceae bacterium]|nr:hypothetical protein [Planctomycetaceae bacterium]
MRLQSYGLQFGDTTKNFCLPDDDILEDLTRDHTEVVAISPFPFSTESRGLFRKSSAA